MLPLCSLLAAVAYAPVLFSTRCLCLRPPLPAAASYYLCDELSYTFCDHIALIHRWTEWVKRPLRQPTADAGGCGYLTSGPLRAGKDIDNGCPRFNDNRDAPSEVYMKTKRRAAASHTTSTLRPLLPYTLEAVQVAGAFRCQSCSQPPHYDIIYMG